MCRYGIPCTLITDNGKQFHNHNFREFCKNLKIELKFCSPAHPTGEWASKDCEQTIKKMLKTRLGKKKRAWVDELPGVLWVHRTTYKTAPRETTFALAFGDEAVIPVEIRMRMHCTEHFNKEQNDE